VKGRATSLLTPGEEEEKKKEKTKEKGGKAGTPSTFLDLTSYSGETKDGKPRERKGGEAILLFTDGGIGREKCFIFSYSEGRGK